jgi:hypothetical protein
MAMFDLRKLRMEDCRRITSAALQDHAQLCE